VSANLQLFGPAHLAILATVPTTAGVLTAFARRQPDRGRRIAAGLGSLLAANELLWYAYRLRQEGVRFPEGLPLELCDLTLWLTVASMFSLRPTIFEFAYLAGVAGSAMALITPDLWAPLLSYPSTYFFLEHGGVVASLLFLVWTGLARPRPGCVWRALGLVNGYAAALGLFDAVFHSNYMYLCRKPESASLLDLFGPWPAYLLEGEAVGLALFWLLWLPFRRGRRGSNVVWRCSSK
jgi:hypothetical integral membrane protein (TIGR02206 family)